MLKHRIIPCVLLKDWQLVKSVNFSAFRTIGHPTATVRVYNSRNVDELIVLDIDAGLQGECINIELIEDMAEECFMPLTIGGGIRTIEDIYTVLNAGADKIAINSIALENPSFIREAANIFGSQCIVCSIDVKKIDGQYYVYNKSQGNLDLDPFELAKTYQEQGAGELLITSVDHEGLTNGYDLELIQKINQSSDIPIIINGGAGTPEHCVDAIQAGADAVAAAYIFHFSQFTPSDIKHSLKTNNIPVRK